MRRRDLFRSRLGAGLSATIGSLLGLPRIARAQGTRTLRFGATNNALAASACGTRRRRSAMAFGQGRHVARRRRPKALRALQHRNRFDGLRQRHRGEEERAPAEIDGGEPGQSAATLMDL